MEEEEDVNMKEDVDVKEEGGGRLRHQVGGRRTSTSRRRRTRGGWRWHAVSLGFALFDSKCFEDNK